MPNRDYYEAWKRHRAAVPVSDDFADRVMDSVRRRQRMLNPRKLVQALRGLLRSPVFRVGVCSLAGVAGLLRVLQVVAFFLANQPSR